MFSQILKLIPRIEFETLVKKTNAEHAAARAGALDTSICQRAPSVAVV